MLFRIISQYPRSLWTREIIATQRATNFVPVMVPRMEDSQFGDAQDQLLQAIVVPHRDLITLPLDANSLLLVKKARYVTPQSTMFTGHAHTGVTQFDIKGPFVKEKQTH